MGKVEKVYQEFNQSDERADETRGNRVLKGLQVLAKYTDEFSVEPAHDEIFTGFDEEYREKMSEEDIKELFILGWRWDSEVDSFAIFT